MFMFMFHRTVDEPQPCMAKGRLFTYVLSPIVLLVITQHNVQGAETHYICYVYVRRCNCFTRDRYQLLLQLQIIFFFFLKANIVRYNYTIEVNTNHKYSSIYSLSTLHQRNLLMYVSGKLNRNMVTQYCQENVSTHTTHTRLVLMQTQKFHQMENSIHHPIQFTELFCWN